MPNAKEVSHNFPDPAPVLESGCPTCVFAASLFVFLIRKIKVTLGSVPPPTNIWACVPGRCSPGNLDEGVRRLYIRDVPEQIDLIQEQQVDNRNQELPSRLRHVLLGSVNLQPPISALFQVL